MIPSAALKAPANNTMKTIAIAIITACLASCAGVSVSALTPWADIESIDGVTVVIPKPLVIPSHK
jgi:hypothetical protein